MKISINNLENSVQEVIFEVPAEELARHIEKTKTLAEASESLIKDSWQKAIKEKELEPIGPAQISIIQMVPGQTAKFKVTVPVLPEVKLPDYHALAKLIKKETPEVTEEDVSGALKSWQLSQARFEALDRPAEKGDFVQIEFTSSLFPGDPQRDQFILGEGHLVPGFEEKLIGLATGQEQEFELTYPDPYFVSHLAGKEAHFRVKMLKVEKVNLVEVEELIKQQNVAESLDDLKEQVRTDLENQAQLLSSRKWRQEVLIKIAEETEVELPKMMVEYEQLRLIESLKRQVSEQLKTDFADYLKKINQKEEDLKKTYQMEAERNVKQFLVLRSLLKAEEINVSEKEVAEESEKIKASLDEKQRAEVDQEQLRNYTRDALTRDRLFQKLSSK
jgi:trigger factor